MDGLERREAPGEGTEAEQWDDEPTDLEGLDLEGDSDDDLPEDASVVYLSHGGGDHGATLVLKSHLHKLGCRSVVLEDVTADSGRSDREQAIRANLPGSVALVVVWSQSAADSHWCAFEATLAKALAKPMFLIVLDDAELPGVLADVPAIQWQGALSNLTDGLQAAGLIEGDAAGLSGAWLAAVSPDPAGTSVVLEAPAPPEVLRTPSHAAVAPVAPPPPAPPITMAGAPAPTAPDSPKSEAAVAPVAPPAVELPPLDRVPYPGLSGFTEDDAELFFGRDADVADVLVALEELTSGGGPRVLLLVGPSGAGKSSLLRAGVVPRLRDDGWVVPAVISGRGSALDQLTDAVDDAMEARGHSAPSWTGDERQRGGTLFTAANKLGEEGHVILAVDHLEGVLLPGPRNRRFFDTVRSALEGASSRLTLVATVRSEYLGDLLEVPALRNVRPACLSVGPLTADQVANAILGPAQRAGSQFDPALASRLVSNTRGPAALPQLALALSQLWAGDGERKHVRAWTMDARVISLARSMETVAQAALAEADAGQLEALRRALLQMVRVDDVGRLQLRWLSAGKVAPEAVEAIEGLHAQGLVCKEGEDSEAQYLLAHESLTRGWPLLREWIEEERDLQRWKQRLEGARTAWADQGREAAALLRGDALGEAAVWLARRPADHNPDQRDFVEQSQKAGRRTVRVRLMATIGAFAAVGTLAALAGTWAWHSKEEVQDSRLNMARALEIQEAAVLEEKKALVSARRAYTGLALQAARAESDPLNAALALSSIASVATEPPGGVVAVRAVLDRPVPYRVVEDAGKPVLAFSPTLDRMLRVGDDAKTVHIVRDGGQIIGSLSAHDSPVIAAAFAPGGQQVATGTEDGSVRVWRADGEGTSTGLLPPADRAQAVTSLAFTDDSRAVVVGTAAGTWVRPVDGLGEAWAAPEGVVGPEGRQVAALQEGQVVVSSPAGEPLAFDAPGAQALDWSADGRRLVIGYADGRVESVAPGGEANPVGRMDGPVQAVAWSRDGARIAAASDGERRTWDTDAGTEQVYTLTPEHDASIRVASLGFGQRGAWVVAQDVSGRIDAHRPGEVGIAAIGASRLPRSIDAVRRARTTPSRSGARLATVAPDGSARFWNLETRAGDVVLRGADGVTRSTAVAPDGTWIAREGSDGSVVVWRRSRPDEVGRLLAARSTDPKASLADEGAEPRLRFSPDGKSLFLARNDGSAVGWSVDDWTVHWEAEAVAGTGWSRVDPTGSWQTLVDGAGKVSVRATSVGGLLRELGSHRRGIQAARFSRTPVVDEVVLVTGGTDWQVGVWPLADGAGYFLEGHRGPVVSVDVDEEAGRVLSAWDDGTTRIWKTETKVEESRIELPGGEPVEDARFTGRGNQVVAVQNGSVVSWSVERRVELGRWNGDLHGGVLRQEVSDDGQRLMVQTRDGSVLLLEGTRLDVAVPLQGAGLAGATAQFGGAGQWLSIPAEDATLRLYATGWESGQAQIQRSTQGACLAPVARERILQETTPQARRKAEACRNG